MSERYAVEIASGFSPAGFEEYGRAMLRGFAAHWPADCRLTLYTEQDVELPAASRPAIRQRNLWRDVPRAASFRDRHHANPLAKGYGRDGAQEYNWRQDAMKWFRQVMIAHDAAARCCPAFPDSEQLFVWLDGDVMTHRDVPAGLVAELLGGADVAYLGRAPKHSEIGFLAFRLPAALPLLRLWCDLYASDRIFQLREWHSAFAFDHAREAVRPLVRSRDLTPGGRGHVWHSSPLARYTDHLKGARKAAGRSPERIA